MESMLHYLDGAFGWLLRTSGEAAVVACIVLVVQGLLRNRLEARWRYALWLILLARLLMPWTPPSPTSIFNFLPAASVETLPITVTQPTVQDVEQAAPAVPAPSVAVTVPAPRPSLFTPLRMAWLLWLLGAVAFGVHVAIENLRFWQKLSKTELEGEETLRELLAECKALVSVRTAIRVIVTDAVTSPALFGCFRPRLLMPRAMLGAGNAEQLRYVILHELAHVKRHDLLVNWLTTLLQVAHWFNPVLWYAFYRMRMDREPACDARALSYLHPDESASYGQTILDLLESYQVRRVPGMAGILEDKTHITRRIKMISLFTRNSYRWSLLACLILGAIGTLVLTKATSAKAMESRRWYPAFNKVYALADGEVLKLVPPPFIPERAKIAGKPDNHTAMFVHTSRGWGYMATCEVAQDSAGQFYLTSSLPLKKLIGSLVANQYPLSAHHVPLCDFDLPDALAKMPVPPGDWVLDPNASIDAVLKALEAILRDQWKRDVRFEQRKSDRDVVVMSGEFKFTPLPDAQEAKTVYIFADRNDPGPSRGGLGGYGGSEIPNNMNNMQFAIEEYLGIHVVNESHGEVNDVKRAEFSLTPEERVNPDIRNRVLANLTKQTGLDFRMERRVLPTWTMLEGSVAPMTDMKAAAPQASATQPAPADSSDKQSDWRPAFESVYSLADGEALKLVPPPFIPERTNYWRTQDPDRFRTTASPEPPPDYCVLGFEDGSFSSKAFWLPSTSSQAYNLPPLSLDSLLGFLRMFPLCDLDAPAALAQLPVPPGDWVMDQKASPTAVLKALEAILRDQWKRDVRFEHKDMERDVVVMSGKFRFTPIPNAERPKTVYFFADWTDHPFGKHLRYIGGKMDNMKSALEEYLRIPAINETHGEPKGVRNAEFPLVEAEDRQNPETRSRALANLTKQTGLDFRIERRVLPTWTMLEGSVAPAPEVKTVTVQSSAIQPAPADNSDEQSDWRPAFERMYALADGEVLKRVPPPYIPERASYCRSQVDATAPPTCSPATCMFSYEDGKFRAEAVDFSPITSQSQVSELPSHSLDTLIGWLPGFHRCDFDLPAALSKLPVAPGDWVVDKRASPTAILRAFEAILRDQWKRDVRFEQKEMERDVVVMSGKFKFTPIPDAKKPKTIYFFADWTAPPDDKSSNRGDGVTYIGGKMDSLKSAIERYLWIPAINETHGKANGVRDAEFPVLEAEECQNPEIRNRVLANITKQTGLDFRIERRVLPTWTMSERAADSTPE